MVAEKSRGWKDMPCQLSNNNVNPEQIRNEYPCGEAPNYPSHQNLLLSESLFPPVAGEGKAEQ